MGPKSTKLEAAWGLGTSLALRGVWTREASPVPSYSRVCESLVQGCDSVEPWMGWRGLCSAERCALGSVLQTSDLQLHLDLTLQYLPPADN